MKKLLAILFPGLLWSSEAFARVRICHGSGSCDHLIIPAALIALGISIFFFYNFLSLLKYEKRIHEEMNKKFDINSFFKSNWSDLLFILIFFHIGIYLLTKL